MGVKRAVVPLSVERDTTLRWSCREGDFVLWIRCGNILAAPQPVIVDLWALRDGDWVTITNRVADLPVWFELHPTEVQGLLVYDMKRKLERGHQPGEVMDGPNLWRLKTGDRLAWLGVSRPGAKQPTGSSRSWISASARWPSANHRGNRHSSSSLHSAPSMSSEARAATPSTLLSAVLPSELFRSLGSQTPFKRVDGPSDSPGSLSQLMSLVK